MYDIYIFDLDGTLLDTIEDLWVAVNYALEQSDLPKRTVEEVTRFVGNGVPMLIRRAIGDNVADFEKVLADFRAYYRSHNAVHTKPYDGIMELLRELKNRGKKTAIVSNKMDELTKALSKTYFDGLIDVALGENEQEGFRRKPARDSVDLALKKLNAQNDSAVYVGDMEVDIQTGLNSGLACISVTWGFRSEEFLRENGGTIFAKKPEEILNF